MKIGVPLEEIILRQSQLDSFTTTDAFLEIKSWLSAINILCRALTYCHVALFSCWMVLYTYEMIMNILLAVTVVRYTGVHSSFSCTFFWYKMAGCFTAVLQMVTTLQLVTCTMIFPSTLRITRPRKCISCNCP